MELFSKIFVSLYLLFAVVACKPNDISPPILPIDRLSEFEQSLVGTWKYIDIQINGTTYLLADNKSEPGNKQFLTDFGFRAELARRRINYSTEKTYQLRWVDRGNYELGTEGDPNWQPNFGFWYYNPVADSVIHNIGLGYSISYKITVTDNYMERESKRYMSSQESVNYGRTWQEGEIVTYIETFSRIE